MAKWHSLPVFAGVPTFAAGLLSLTELQTQESNSKLATHRAHLGAIRLQVQGREPQSIAAFCVVEEGKELCVVARLDLFAVTRIRSVLW